MSPATADNMLSSAETTQQQERKVLALEALSNLTDQFARNPDLQTLIDSIVLTVAGQFALTGVLIISRSNNLNADELLSSATGKLRGIRAHTSYLTTAAEVSRTLAGPRPAYLDKLVLGGGCENTLQEWRAAGVRVCVPLATSGSTFGAILIGSRVGHLQFSESDIDLLQHFASTITPLLANSLLYADMAALSDRHLQILDSVRQAILVFDSTGKLVTANRAAARLNLPVGNEGDVPLGAGSGIEKVFPHDTFPGWAERLRSLQSNRSMRIPTTMIAKGRDGDRVFSVSIHHGINLSASQDGVVMALDDKTEETTNERRIFELEKFAEQGIMASSISHELNNHLGMILGGAELALVANEKGDHSRVSATLAKLKESITRMERFTAGLMDYSRVNPQKQDTDINAVVSDVVSFASAQKRFSSITLLANLMPQLPSMQIDRDQIAQVIINILNNAADAIIESERRDGLVTVSTMLNDAEVVLSVSDNGKGMPPEVKEKLFKAHLTTKPRGHGYGLTTCGRILAHHNAKIQVESEPGSGTTFRFGFPISPPDSKCSHLQK